MNLADLYGTSQRRNTPGVNLASAIHAMVPSHQSLVASDRDRTAAAAQFDTQVSLEQDRLAEEKRIAEENARLSEQSLALSAAAQAAAEEQAAAEAEQAQKAQLIQGISTVGTLASLVGKENIVAGAKGIGSGLSSLYTGAKGLVTGTEAAASQVGATTAAETALTSSEAAGAIGETAGTALTSSEAAAGTSLSIGETAGTALTSSEAAGTGAAAAESTGTAAAGGSSGMSAGTLGIIGAVIMGQHLLSGQTDRRYEDVETKDVFGGHFLTEPWKGFANKKLGFDASSGEKMDAAIENSEWGKVAMRTPATLNQWANPIGDFAYDAVKSGVREVFHVPDQTADIIMAVVDPISAAVKFVEDVGGDSWLCSECATRCRIPYGQAKRLLRFRGWCWSNHRRRTAHYLKVGPALVGAINAAVDDRRAVWDRIRTRMIEPVTRLFDSGRREAAYRVYVGMTMHLARRYAPELMPDF